MRVRSFFLQIIMLSNNAKSKSKGKKKSNKGRDVIASSSEDSIVNLINMYSMKEKQGTGSGVGTDHLGTQKNADGITINDNQKQSPVYYTTYTQNQFPIHNSTHASYWNSMQQNSKRKGPLAQWEENQKHSEGKISKSKTQSHSQGHNAQPLNLQNNRTSSPTQNIEATGQMDENSSSAIAQSNSNQDIADLNPKIPRKPNISQVTDYHNPQNSSPEEDFKKSNEKINSARSERSTKSDKDKRTPRFKKNDSDPEYQLKNEVISLREKNEELSNELISLGFEYEKIYKFVTLKMKEKTFNITEEFLTRDQFPNSITPIQEEPSHSGLTIPDINELKLEIKGRTPTPDTSRSTHSSHSYHLDHSAVDGKKDSITSSAIYHKNLTALKNQSEEHFKMQESLIYSLEERLKKKDFIIEEHTDYIKKLEDSINRLERDNERYVKEIGILTSDYNLTKQQLEKIESMMAKKDHLLEEYRAENESAEEHYKLQLKRRDSTLKEIRRILVKDLMQKQEMQLENVTPRREGEGIRIRSMQVPHIHSMTSLESLDNKSTRSSLEIRLGQLNSSELYINHLSSEIKSIIAKRDYWKRRVKGLEMKYKHLETLGKNDKQKAAQLDITIRKVEQQSQMILNLTDQLRQFKIILKEKLISSPLGKDLFNDAFGTPGSSGTQLNDSNILNKTDFDTLPTSTDLRRMTDPYISSNKSNLGAEMQLTKEELDKDSSQNQIQHHNQFQVQSLSHDSSGINIVVSSNNSQSFNDSNQLSPIQSTTPKEMLPPKYDNSPNLFLRRKSLNDKNSKWDFMKKNAPEQLSMVTIHNVGSEVPHLDPRGLRSAPSIEESREGFLPMMKPNSRGADIMKMKWKAKFRSKYVSQKQ